jgi:hypothetical protein
MEFEPLARSPSYLDSLDHPGFMLDAMDTYPAFDPMNSMYLFFACATLADTHQCRPRNSATCQ